ncbi:MAG: GT4 family glycosyltransferase PelF [Candidatus Korobacteraceae bacterium]
MSERRPISVLLTTEGTYPFYAGGVSTWCHRLTHGLPDVDFTLLAVVTNPYPQIRHDLAPNVQGVIKVPQWGLLQPAEYSHHQPASMVLRNLWDTTPSAVAARFKPMFERFLALVLSSQSDMEELGQVLLGLQSYFQRYDYQRSMNSIEAWNVLQHAVRATWECRPPATENPTLAEVKQAYRLLYHLLMVLHFPIPRADITHSSAASFCGIPCVLAKLTQGTPYLLTEHGVYLREQYLNLRRQVKSYFVRWFLYRLVENVVALNYHFADQVSPVCAYNSRWEKHLGVTEERIKVIFNGADPDKFRRCEPEHNGRALISSVGLIYPLKGQLDLIDAAAILRPSFQDLEVRFYGAPSDPAYFENCRRKVSELNLENNVTFAGSTKEPWKVYSSADVMVFPSISEGFPYVVLEAMLCGAAIVATDVGGVGEALGNCGLLVPSKTPYAIADAISSLLANPGERERLGRSAQARALEHFTEQQFLSSYENTYRELLTRRLPQVFQA